MIIEASNYNFEDFKVLKVLPKAKKSGKTYLDAITAFDIETTRLPEIEQAVMYHWQFQIEDTTIVGRTWDEYREFIRGILSSIPKKGSLVVFVHNLSYEFQYLRGIHAFATDDVQCIKSRKILRATAENGRIEYRCSYLHSNMGLDEYCKKMGVKHGKLSGKKFDYSKRRLPWTPLSDYEREYCVNDVLGLVEAIKIEMKHDGDNLYTFPLTSTGYVRRDIKAAMSTPANRSLAKYLAPSLDVYQMLREAFRGGNTHANRWVVGDILEDVKSFDRSSSYPDVQMNCRFPVSPFQNRGGVSCDKFEELLVMGKAILAHVKLYNVTLRDKYWGAPYLATDKCRRVTGAVYDNGRILSAEYLETTLTDIDFRILVSEYNFDYEAFDVYTARYGKLPREVLDEIGKYYRLKTELKGEKGSEILYTKAKNKLNSVYGMSAQNPAKPETLFGEEFEESYKEDDTAIAELLDESNEHIWFPYTWGVWTTAWARYRLEEGIALVHSQGATFVYCDTDSVKYYGDADWSTYNAERIEDSKKSGAFAREKEKNGKPGKLHFMGVYEDDGEYKEFRTWGAKKYAYTVTGEKTYIKGREMEKFTELRIVDKVHLTLAGVGKKSGAKELEQFGGLEAFKPGFTFVAGGGTESLYNDRPEITQYATDGGVVEIVPNIVIRDSRYRLGITTEYWELLNELDDDGWHSEIPENFTENT